MSWEASARGIEQVDLGGEGGVSRPWSPADTSGPPSANGLTGQLKPRLSQNLHDELERLTARVNLEPGKPGSVDAEVLRVRPLAHSLSLARAPDGVPDLCGVHLLTMPGASPPSVGSAFRGGRVVETRRGQPGPMEASCG